MNLPQLGTLFRSSPKGESIGAQLILYKDEEIYVGRDNSCDFQILDGHVSNKHLRIYCITYDDANPESVAPMVYAQNLSRFGTAWNGYHKGEQGETFLLSDGDILRLTPGIYLSFTSLGPAPKDSFSEQQRREIRLFEKDYVITRRLLGFGSYGRVHMGYRANDGKQLACKVIDLTSIRKMVAEAPPEKKVSKVSDDKKQLVAAREPSPAAANIDSKVKAMIKTYEREAKILAGLLHPNIISLEKAIRCDETLYIFTELVTAGDLCSFIFASGGMLEPTTAAVITLQLLLAVQYIHERKIVHRDIKPDNILLTSQEDGGRVILTDFGVAKKVQEPTKRLSTVVGTREYCAPEIFHPGERGYTKAVDMWSLGRVITHMLVGWSPECGPNYEDDLDSMEDAVGVMGIPGNPMSLLRRLLSPFESERPDAEEALRHSWFASLPNKFAIDQRYQHLVRTWKSRPHTTHGARPITYLTSTISPTSYQHDSETRTSTTWITEEYTLFPHDDHVSESAFSDAYSSQSQSQHSLPPPEMPTGDLEFVSQVKRVQGEQKLPKGKYLYIAPGAIIPDSPEMEEPVQPEPRPRWRYVSIAPRENIPDQPEIGMASSNPTNLRGRAYEAPRPAPANTSLPDMAAHFQLPAWPPRNPFAPPFPPADKPARPNTMDAQIGSQGEVYEEVRNPVTGKRKRYIYGKTEEELSELCL